MKKIIYFTLLISIFSASSCKKDLLVENDPSKLSAENYFNTIPEATAAMFGAYAAARDAFAKPYAWDGASDMMYSRVNARPYTYVPSNATGSQFSAHWNALYKAVNRSNYVLFNVRNMIAKETPANVVLLRRIEAETLFLRALAYFRLIDLWGDVPYYENILNGNEDAYALSKTSKATIKDNIIKDLDFAIASLPATVVKSENGRVTKAAAYGYRGKIKLYWACWMKIAGNTAEATSYYTAAANDFAEVMKPVYGRSLYNNGLPGTPTAPSYSEMFDGLQVHEDTMYASETIFSFTNGAGFGYQDPSANTLPYGDTYLYDFGTRSTAGGGGNVQPTTRLVNRYQLISTGGFAPPVTPVNPTVLPANADARTRANSAINPATYAGRDYRCYATILWDGASLYEITSDGNLTSNLLTYQFKTTAPSPPWLFAELPITGYMYRKFVRQISGFSRENGPQDSWMMRLPDVWLMYAEATNEVSGPTAAAYDLVDKIRQRSGLPVLNRANFATQSTFFDAIEQERIVELAAEGHRFFDIRRWKKAEQIWPQPNGFTLTDTWGVAVAGRDEFKNATARDFQRYYIFQIPTGEITNNPKITQNDPWL